jgi:hypothetical protein
VGSSFFFFFDFFDESALRFCLLLVGMVTLDVLALVGGDRDTGSVGFGEAVGVKVD